MLCPCVVDVVGVDIVGDVRPRQCVKRLTGVRMIVGCTARVGGDNKHGHPQTLDGSKREGVDHVVAAHLRGMGSVGSRT